jgi:Reverse transcriptase (RNA-dependent DNA polymerase)
MLDAKVIEPAASEWASPIVLIPKPDGSLRFCVDHRKLNSITIRDQYALPRLDDCIDSLGEARVFSTLDANSGYWQIKVAEESKDKTAFTCHRGLYRFTRMPFGLCNAPATFQRAVDVILATVRWQCAITYLDDIIVY